MIKLIASDMDGTLLNSSKKIDLEFFNLLKKMKEKGIIMVFASGRNLQSLRSLVPVEYYNDILFISDNGSQITYKDETIFIQTLSIDDLKSITSCIEDIKNIRCVVSTPNKIYTNSFKNLLIAKIRGYNQKYIRNFNKIGDNPIKFTIFSKECTQEELLIALNPISEKFNITPSGKGTIDVICKDVNKGMAINIIQSKFNVLKSETMVFGDYLNDMEMMECAYYSYAMENAHSKLKDKARFIAKHHNEKGVILAIEEKINHDE